MDEAVFRAVNTQLAGTVMDQVMLAVSSKWTWLAAAVVLVGYTAFRRNLRLASFCVLVATTVGISDGTAYQIMKPAFARERPCHQLEAVRLVQDRCGSDYGFPSNHASNGMAVAVAAALVFPRRRVLWAFFGSAVLVGFSRVYLGVHFPGDVLAGFAFGSVVALLWHFVYRRLAAKWLPLTDRPGNRRPPKAFAAFRRQPGCKL